MCVCVCVRVCVYVCVYVCVCVVCECAYIHTRYIYICIFCNKGIFYFLELNPIKYTTSPSLGVLYNINDLYMYKHKLCLQYILYTVHNTLDSVHIIHYIVTLDIDIALGSNYKTAIKCHIIIT